MNQQIGRSEREHEIYRRVLRKRMLMYGFIVSVIGLPVGVALNLPYVWGLALLGIAVGAAKLMVARARANKGK